MSSLAGLALRLAAVRLLRGQTLAATVADSALAPIDTSLAHLGGQRPSIIIVTTGDEEAEHVGIDILAGKNGRMVDLVVEIAIADELTDEGVTIPQTDSGLELSLSLISRQVVRALFHSERDTQWSRVFKGMACSIEESVSRRGLPEPKGDRFAARQLVFRVNVADEPLFGAEPEGVWAEFLDAIAAEPEIASLAPLLRATIVGDAIPDLDRGPADHAIREDAASLVDIGPLPEIDEEPVLDGVEIEDQSPPASVYAYRGAPIRIGGETLTFIKED